MYWINSSDFQVDIYGSLSFFYVACNLSHGHNYYVPNLGVLRCAVQPVCSAVKN